MTARRTLLARFAWPGDAAITQLRAALPAVGGGIFRALEGDATYAYMGGASEGDAATVAALVPAAQVARMDPLADIAGASRGCEAPFHYIVETDVVPEIEDDFNAWYDREHLPGLAAVEGTVRAARYRNVDGHPRYHACYDLVGVDTLGSPAWLAVRGTLWSSRIRPAFVNTRRTMLRRV